jgi:hypothetical protein
MGLGLQDERFLPDRALNGESTVTPLVGATTHRKKALTTR